MKENGPILNRNKNIPYNEKVRYVYINRPLCIHIESAYLLFFVGLEVSMSKESDFKTKLYKEIRTKFPGSEVLPNDPNLIQGFPDATVYLPNGKYILLEGKKTSNSARQQNQDYYVNHSPLSPNAMYAYPENKKEVLQEIERRYKSEV